MIRVAVTGAAGRMGSGIIRKITEQDDMEVVAAIEMPNTPLAGKDAGLQAGIDELGVEITGSENLNVKDNNVPAVISSNMAIGVNVFFNTLKKLAPLLYDFDIEIIEAHHNQKKDAPSGTAMTAFEVIAKELERDPEEVGVYGRKGLVGKRTAEEIGVHAIRGGDIVGDHTVMFVGDGERIELKHQAHTREVFIAGVIRAIRYIPNAETGVVSSMNDVLGLD